MLLILSYIDIDFLGGRRKYFPRYNVTEDNPANNLTPREINAVLRNLNSRLVRSTLKPSLQEMAGGKDRC